MKLLRKQLWICIKVITLGQLLTARESPSMPANVKTFQLSERRYKHFRACSIDYWQHIVNVRAFLSKQKETRVKSVRAELVQLPSWTNIRASRATTGERMLYTECKMLTVWALVSSSRPISTPDSLKHGRCTAMFVPSKTWTLPLVTIRPLPDFFPRAMLSRCVTKDYFYVEKLLANDLGLDNNEDGADDADKADNNWWPKIINNSGVM